MNTLVIAILIILNLFLFFLLAYFLFKKKFWLATILIVAIIVFLGIMVIDNSEKTDKGAMNSTEKKSNRLLSKTFTIPGGATITVKNMFYTYYGKGKRDRIIVEVKSGSHKDLIWLNKNLPAIQMKRIKTIIYAAPPGTGRKNRISFMNLGGGSITVRIRILPYRT